MDGRGLREPREARGRPTGLPWADPPAAHPALPWLAPGAPPGGPAPPRGTTPPGTAPPRGTARGRVVALAVVAALLLAVAAGLALRPGAAATTVVTPFLTYEAPPGWTAGPAGDAAPALTGVVHGPGYACGGEEYLRGFAAAALLPADATPSGPAERAAGLARWFAADSYGAPADAVAVAPPRAVRIAGPAGPVDATITEATITEATVTGATVAGATGTAAPGAADPGTTGTAGIGAAVHGGAAPGGCPPATGTVLVLAAPTSGGAALLLVAADTGGGPADPAPPDRAVLDAVLAGARLTG